MTNWNKIKKKITVDLEFIVGWHGNLYVLFSFAFWVPYHYASVGSPDGLQGIERKLMQAIFGRNEGQIQFTIPFARITYIWGVNALPEDKGWIFEWGWSTANADMYYKGKGITSK